jgi:hypothetical protein
MNEPPLYMVFDVESVGLHGLAYAFGYVLVDRDGNDLGSGRFSLPPEKAADADEPTDKDGLEWVKANAPPLEVNCPHFHALCEAFWAAWLRNKSRGAVLVADCPWPVEARFLAECVDWALAKRFWEGPYPLIDVASVRLAAGFDPLATVDRLPNELPIHDPLADARQSARLLIEALNAVRKPQEEHGR